MCCDSLHSIKGFCEWGHTSAYPYDLHKKHSFPNKTKINILNLTQKGKKKKRLVGLGEIKTWKKCNIIQQETLNHTEGDGDAARDNEGWGIVRRGTGNRTANHKAWNPESYGEGPRIVQQILRRGTPDRTARDPGSHSEPLANIWFLCLLIHKLDLFINMMSNCLILSDIFNSILWLPCHYVYSTITQSIK